MNTQNYQTTEQLAPEQLIAAINSLTAKIDSVIAHLKAKNTNADGTIKVGEVARITGYSPATIYNKVCNGEIPYIKIGKKSIAFDPIVIKSWAAAHTKRKKTRQEQAQQLIKSTPFHLL